MREPSARYVKHIFNKELLADRTIYRTCLSTMCRKGSRQRIDQTNALLAKSAKNTILRRYERKNGRESKKETPIAGKHAVVGCCRMYGVLTDNLTYNKCANHFSDGERT